HGRRVTVSASTTSASGCWRCLAATRGSIRGQTTGGTEWSSRYPVRPMTEAPTSRLRVVIVDDEALARAVLREYLSAASDVEIVAECQNGFEAVKIVSE